MLYADRRSLVDIIAAFALRAEKPLTARWLLCQCYLADRAAAIDSGQTMTDDMFTNSRGFPHGIDTHAMLHGDLERESGGRLARLFDGTVVIADGSCEDDLDCLSRRDIKIIDLVAPLHRDLDDALLEIVLMDRKAFPEAALNGAIPDERFFRCLGMAEEDASACVERLVDSRLIRRSWDEARVGAEHLTRAPLRSSLSAN
jgi:hypothetical protein